MPKKYDVIVIGAGSGLTFSSLAAQMGKKVAIVEAGPFGGTCLNRGCIPSKLLIHSADVADTIRTSQTFGISSKITKINWKKIINKVTNYVDKHAKNVEQGNKQLKNVTIYKTTGKFIGKKLLKVGKDTITAPLIFIAAGARPNIPPIPGLKDVPYMTSKEALRCKKQPKHLLCIGGGYIGSELAHFYGSLGTKITIIDRGNRLMKAEDKDISKRFTTIYKKHYNVIFNANTKKAHKKGKNIALQLEINGKKKTITGDALLIATGRKPNTDILDVAATGVKTNKRGFINVNKYMETNVPGIYAIGDIAGVWMFKHSANLEAEYAAQNAFGKKKIPVDYTAMPHAAFTSPQVAGVGYTEDQLIKKNTPYVKATYDYIDTGYGKALEDKDGFVKVLAHPKTRKILGCHIIGSEASILIHEVVVAMKAGLGVDGIVNAVHIHPALNEVVQRAFNQI